MKRLMEGLRILEGYDPNGNISADHDEISVIIKQEPQEMELYHISQLNELGFHYEEEYGSWVKYV